MAQFNFVCPCQGCGTIRKISPNTGFTCTGCKTRYSIGPNGEIRSAHPPKK